MRPRAGFRSEHGATRARGAKRGGARCVEGHQLPEFAFAAGVEMADQIACKSDMFADKLANVRDRYEVRF